MRRRDFIHLIFGAGAAWPFAEAAVPVRRWQRVQWQ